MKYVEERFSPPLVLRILKFITLYVSGIRNNDLSERLQGDNTVENSIEDVRIKHAFHRSYAHYVICVKMDMVGVWVMEGQYNQKPVIGSV